MAIEPYIYPIRGKDHLINSFCEPIVSGGAFAGVSCVDLDLSGLNTDMANVNQNNHFLIILSVVSILIAAAILFVVLNKLVGSPLKGLGKTFDRMASGDHDTDVPEAKRINEIRLIGKAVMGFRDSLRLKASDSLRQQVQQFVAQVRRG